jgi:hypothetical protein
MAIDFPAMHFNEAVVRLLRGIAAQGHIHLAELECDRTQVEQLLASAMGRLGERCTRLCSLLAMVEGAGAADREQLVTITHSIVTDLQIHDLVSQVLQRSQHRIRGVGALLDQISQACATLENPTATRPTDVAGIAQTSRSILDASTQLSAQLPRRVEQTSSDAGEIVLF